MTLDHICKLQNCRQHRLLQVSLSQVIPRNVILWLIYQHLKDNFSIPKSRDWTLPIPGLRDWRIRPGSRNLGSQDCNPYAQVTVRRVINHVILLIIISNTCKSSRRQWASCERRTDVPCSVSVSVAWVNPLMGTGNYYAISNNMKLVHWPLMGGLLRLVQRWGDGGGASPPRPLIAVPNVTAHPSTASVPTTVLLYNGPLLCGFNVPIKGLNTKLRSHRRQQTLWLYCTHTHTRTHTPIRTNDTLWGKCIVGKIRAS